MSQYLKVHLLGRSPSFPSFRKGGSLLNAPQMGSGYMSTSDRCCCHLGCPCSSIFVVRQMAAQVRKLFIPWEIPCSQIYFCMLHLCTNVCVRRTWSSHACVSSIFGWLNGESMSVPLFLLHGINSWTWESFERVLCHRKRILRVDVPEYL